MPGADLVVRCQAGGETINEVQDKVGKAVASNGVLRIALGAGTSELAVQAGGDVVIHALPAP